METHKRIYNKLADKVELASEKIELSLINDIKKQYQEVKSNNSKLLDIKKKYINGRRELLSFSDIVEEQAKRMEELILKAKNVSKELGIETPKELVMYENTATSYVQNVKEARKAARS